MARACAIVFPGQGSQSLGMLERLPDVADLDRLIDAAEALADLPLRDIAAGTDEVALADTRVAQPLLYLADWAWGVTLLSEGLEPCALAGHSLGELAAIAVAGCFSVEAGLELVCMRSRLMADAAAERPGTMAAVLGLELDAISAALDDVAGVWVANNNAPGQVVISGTREGVDRAVRELSAAGARRIVPLPVSGAFHSPLMQRAADAFADVLPRIPFRDAAYPVIQNALPEPTRDAAVIRERLTAQMASPVRWTETMLGMRDLGVEVLLEAGPGSVLTGLARRIDGILGVAVETEGVARALEEVSS